MWVEKQIQEEKGVFKFRSVSGPSLFEAWVVYSLSFLRALPILGYSAISHPLGSVLPDVSYQVESSEGEDQSQDMGSQGQTVLLFLFVDFHREFPGQKMELWGRYRRMGLPPWMCLNVKRINKRDLGTSLVVQWRRLDAPKLSSAIPGWGTRSHICQLRVHML